MSNKDKRTAEAPKPSTAGEIGSVFLGVAIAVPVLLAFASRGPELFSRWVALPDAKAAADPALRLVFAVRWLAPVCLLVVACVQAVAMCRLLTPAIDGRTPHRVTDLLRSILQNTLEQAFMLALNLLALSQNLSADRLVFIPMAVVFFLAARVAFIVGYWIWPTRRAFGFFLTFAPNVAMAGYNVYCLLG